VKYYRHFKELPIFKADRSEEIPTPNPKTKNDILEKGQTQYLLLQNGRNQRSRELKTEARNSSFQKTGGPIKVKGCMKMPVPFVS